MVRRRALRGPEDEQSNYRLAAETLLGPGARRTRAGAPDGGRARPAGGRPELRRGDPRARARDRLSSPPVSTSSCSGSAPRSRRLAVPGCRTLEPARGRVPRCPGLAEAPTERITLASPCCARRASAFCCDGASKADAVSAMLGEQSRHVPASLLRRERLTVIVDDAAAPAGPPRCQPPRRPGGRCSYATPRPSGASTAPTGRHRSPLTEPGRDGRGAARAPASAAVRARAAQPGPARARNVRAVRAGRGGAAAPRPARVGLRRLRGLTTGRSASAGPTGACGATAAPAARAPPRWARAPTV